MASTLPPHAAQRRKNQCALVQVIAAVILTAAAGEASAQDEPPPSPIEHALVEYLCRSMQGPTMVGTEEYHSCYGTQLEALREPFGRNLSKLTAADRKTLDAWCGQIQTARNRDAYLSCLNTQLVRLKERRAHEKPVEPDVQENEPDTTVDTIAAVAPPSPQPDAASGSAWLILAIAGITASAGGAAFMLMRRPRTPSACHGCGAAVDGSGDMCANCRHEAAEARRRAAAERADEERQQAERAKREAELRDEEARREQERREEALRLAAEVEQRQREEQERRLQRARAKDPTDREEVFDPYAVLGLAPAATAGEIRAAYEQAKAKYDPREYEHFGSELQAHFKAKAEAVERAFQMLCVSE